MSSMNPDQNSRDDGPMLDRESDPFGPPKIPVEVGCLHCGKTYESYLIEWREKTSADGRRSGLWCCPTPGCGGIGFGCDIFPTDPDWKDPEGNLFIGCDDEEEDEADFDDEGEEWKNASNEDDDRASR